VVLALSVPGPFGPAHLGITVVSGPSMLPTYDPGDLVVTWRSGGYPVGTPIVYGIPAGEPGAGMNVVHRVVEVLPGGAHLMQGDNNEHLDPWRPTDADVKGAVVLRVPRGGILLRWFGSPVVLALVSGLLAGASAFSWAGRGGGPRPPGGGAGPPRRHRRRTPRAKVALRAAAGATAMVAALTATVAQAAPIDGVAAADLTSFAVPSSIAANPVSYEQVLTSETALEYCATVTVTNHSDQPTEWEITLNISEQPYNATTVASSYNVTTVSFQPDVWRVKGVPFNAVLAPGASYVWGYCGAREPTGLVDATAVAVPTPNGAQYCAEVTVTTTSTDWIRWRTTVGHTTPGLTDNAYWLAVEPTAVNRVTSISFAAATGSWVVSGLGANEYIRAGTPAAFGYCAPLGAASPLVDATVTTSVGTPSGGQYCADVTVSTTSTTLVKWRATIDHTTVGLTSGVYWLAAEPTNFWNATTVSFAAGTGTWVLKGTASNELIKLGQPATFGFCAPTNANAALVDAAVTAQVTSSGGGHYCANITVATTSPDFVKWRATIDHSTPGLTSPTFWLTTQPTNFWSSESVSFTAATGTWQLRGLSYNDSIKAGSPQTFGFCT
jgi:signal peptidase